MTAKIENEDTMAKMCGDDFCNVGRKIGSTVGLRENEYLNETDGLIYCVKCGTPKEFVLADAGRILHTNCECRTEQIKQWEQQKAEQEHIERIVRMRNNGLTKTQQQCVFECDDLADAETMQIAERYVTNFDEMASNGMGLLFWGSVGTGKTYTALCIANALIDDGISVLATNLAEVVAEAQDWDNANYNFERRLKFKAIVIDDFGIERDTAFAKEQIYNFINECYVRNIPLIVTTNYMPSEIQETADNKSDLTNARICSRILERCIPVKVNAVKRRAIKQDTNKNWVADILGLKQGGVK
jgi:DNA replication protein DnaC